jgi:Mce-associated membrane protein
MTDEPTPAPEPDDAAQPPAGQERSWAPETGWPSSPAPSSAEPEEPVEASDEPELDAWLDAQDTGWAEPEPAAAPEEPTGYGAQAAVAVAPAEEPPSAGADAEAAAYEVAPEEDAPAPVQDEVGLLADAPEPVELPAEDEPAGQEPELVEDAPAAQEPEPVEAHGADPAVAELAAAVLSPVPAEVAPSEPAPVALEEPEAADAGEPAVPQARSATPIVAALVVLVLLLAGLTAFLAQRSVSTRAGGGVEDARHDGLQAARNAARVVFSYDYRHLDKDFAAGKALTTGAFAEQYGTTTPKLVEVAKTYKAVVVADVSDAAVISATESKVVVLVFVNQQSTSTLAAAPKITQSRVTMTVQHRGGRWLVSDVHAF